MLPQSRHDEGLYPVPQFPIEKADIEGFTDESEGFHAVSADCFTRSEPRNNSGRYMIGQLSQLERKSTEPTASDTEGGTPGSMRFAISDAVRDEKKMIAEYHGFLNEDMGDSEGVVISDESGFRKKGEDPAGVARQYCGGSGKVENCQVGVSATYASPHGYAFSDRRLSVPRRRFDEDHKKKREKPKFPESLTFKTKPRSAAEMSEEIVNEGIVPFRYAAADPVYGESDDFINTIESHPGITYFAEVSCDTLCRLKNPVTGIRYYRYKNEKRSERVPAEKEPVIIDKPARGIHNVFRYRRTVSEGTGGHIEYEFTEREVTLCKSGLPVKNVRLIIKRTPDKKNYRFYISNALPGIRLPTFVWLSGIRWATEQCFQEAESESGMDHYEVRKFPGWNHHIIICMPAHFFLWHLRIRSGKKSTVYYFISAQDFT